MNVSKVNHVMAKFSWLFCNHAYNYDLRRSKSAARPHDCGVNVSVRGFKGDRLSHERPQH